MLVKLGLTGTVCSLALVVFFILPFFFSGRFGFGELVGIFLLVHWRCIAFSVLILFFGVLTKCGGRAGCLIINVSAFEKKWGASNGPFVGPRAGAEGESLYTYYYYLLYHSKLEYFFSDTYEQSLG